MTSVDDPATNKYFSPAHHRLLSVLAWVLFALGLLAWFVEGANRPLDPGFAPAVVLLALCAPHIFG
ncbi:MAG TPA: hypothetical protein VHC63_00590 [Acidimicrobiales bacterium]|nr:hypothetical protein [Acidimicrobiales bacterium]